MYFIISDLCAAVAYVWIKMSDGKIPYLFDVIMTTLYNDLYRYPTVKQSDQFFIEGDLQQIVDYIFTDLSSINEFCPLDDSSPEVFEKAFKGRLRIALSPLGFVSLINS